MSSTSTLPTPPDDRPLAVDLFFRLLLYGVVIAVIAAAAFGRLGVSSDVAIEQVGDLQLSVHHAAVTRPGLSSPFDITVTSDGGLPDQIVIELAAAYIGAFDWNTLGPAPVEEFSDGVRERWTFDIPPGATSLGISFDGRLDPSVQNALSTDVVAFVDGHPADLGVDRHPGHALRRNHGVDRPRHRPLLVPLPGDAGNSGSGRWRSSARSTCWWSW